MRDAKKAASPSKRLAAGVWRRQNRDRSLAVCSFGRGGRCRRLRIRTHHHLERTAFECFAQILIDTFPKKASQTNLVTTMPGLTGEECHGLVEAFKNGGERNLLGTARQLRSE